MVSSCLVAITDAIRWAVKAAMVMIVVLPEVVDDLDGVAAAAAVAIVVPEVEADSKDVAVPAAVVDASVVASSSWTLSFHWTISSRTSAKRTLEASLSRSGRREEHRRRRFASSAVV